MEVIDILYLCDDCVVVAVNDDVSALDKEYGDKIIAALRKIGPISYDGEVHESNGRCNCCKRKGFGNRHTFSKFGKVG